MVVVVVVMVVILAVGVTVVVAVVVVINSRQVVTYATHIPQTTRTTRLIFCRHDYANIRAAGCATTRRSPKRVFVISPAQYPEKERCSGWFRNQSGQQH